MKLSILILAFALISHSAYSHYTEKGHNCSHDTLAQNHVFNEIDEDIPAPGEQRLLAEYNQIRITPNFERLSSASASFRDYVQNELVPPVIDYFQAALKIKYPLTKKVSLSSASICDVETPAALRAGVNTDYFLIIDTDFDDTNQWVAQSYNCYMAASSKRPYIGKIVLNQDLFKEPKGDVLMHEKNTYVLMHELIHALGFSKRLYNNFLDENGNPVAEPIKNVTLLGATRMVLNIPSLTERARKYFGCSDLEGVFLEDDGGEESFGSHIEKRQFIMEHMTVDMMNAQRISEFSLGLLEATGWYLPDYSFAEPYYFGQGKGCGFIRDQCSSSKFNWETYGYCSGSGWGCGPHGRGGGQCKKDSYTDQCSFIEPDNNYDCENPNADNYARLPNLQAFGRNAGSKCFTGTLASTSNAITTSFCFKYKCSGSGSNTKVDVTVGSRTVTCSKAGKVSVSGYQGTVDCPDPATFCGTAGKEYCPRNCMGRGKCVNNKCVCNTGFSGVDCGLTGNNWVEDNDDLSDGC